MASTSTSQRWLPRLFQRSSSTSQSSADIISTHTNDRQGDMEFFASLEENTTLAFFRREEVLVGDYLGKGTFTAIGAVVGIDTAAHGGDCSSSVASTSATVNTSFSSQNSKRQELQDSLFVNGQPRYAMKQLTPATLQQADGKTLARAARELVNDAKYLARLAGHPGIVTLRGLTLDAFGHNYLAHQFDDFFLLRDRVSPHTLHDKIYREWRTNVEPDEDLIPIKANYAFQIAKALRWCHQHGVLYRDLKPSNVGFSMDDPHVVQLLEFGLARDIPTIDDSAPYRMTLAGTRRYLAGEVLTSGEYTWKSDVYSWSMVYFEMCTETKPYHGLSAGEHQTYVCQHGDRPTLDDYYFPEALDNILTQSWHPHLHQRWSMDQVCDGMQSFLMQLDLSYYQPKEGDFLFDIDPTPIHVESWTEEFGMASIGDNVSVDAYSVMDQSIRSFYVEEEVAPPLSSSVVVAEHNSQEEDAAEPPKTSSDNLTPPQGLEYVRRASLSSARRMSLSSARRASLSSVKTPEETTSVRRASLSSVQAVTPRRFIPSAA